MLFTANIYFVQGQCVMLFKAKLIDVRGKFQC